MSWHFQSCILHHRSSVLYVLFSFSTLLFHPLPHLRSLLQMKIATITPAPFQFKKSSIPRRTTTTSTYQRLTSESLTSTTSTTFERRTTSSTSYTTTTIGKPPIPTTPSRLPRRSVPDRGLTAFDTGTRSKPVSRSTTPTRRRASTPTRNDFQLERHTQNYNVVGGYMRPTFASRRRSVGTKPDLMCECHHCSASREPIVEELKSFRGSMPRIASATDLSQVVSPVAQYIHENKPILTGRERMRSEGPEERERRPSGLLEVQIPARSKSNLEKRDLPQYHHYRHHHDPL